MKIGQILACKLLQEYWIIAVILKDIEPTCLLAFCLRKSDLMSTEIDKIIAEEIDFDAIVTSALSDVIKLFTCCYGADEQSNADDRIRSKRSILVHHSSHTES